MKKTFKTIAASLLVLPILALGASALVSQTAGADINLRGGVDATKTAEQTTCLFTSAECSEGIITKITNVLLFLIGAISVIMIIFGGFRYVVSGGDSTKVTNAKNTIMYAVIGLIVAILAYAVINFVITNLIVA